MKKQVWFKTDLGYYATRKQIERSDIVADWYEDKGRFTFQLRDFKDVKFQITSKQARLSITYPEEVDHKDFQERVKPLLVKADNTPAEILDIIREMGESKKEAVARSQYALSEHQYLVEVDEGLVVGVIERLRLVLLRPPTVEEIALEAGVFPEVAEKLAHKTAPKTGWHSPSEKQIEDTTRELARILVIAGHIRQNLGFGNVGEEDLEKAKYFLKHHPDLIPKIRVEINFVTYDWPERARKFLREQIPAENLRLDGATIVDVMYWIF